MHASTHATILLTCTACSLHSCPRLLDWPTWWCAHVQKTWRVVKVETGVVHPIGQNIAFHATVSSDPMAALRARWGSARLTVSPCRAQRRHGVTANGCIAGDVPAVGVDDASLHLHHAPCFLHMRTPTCGPVQQAGAAVQTAGGAGEQYCGMCGCMRVPMPVCMTLHV